MNTLYYKDYTAIVEFDADDSIFIGRLAGIDDIAVFHGSTLKELTIAFHELVDHYLEISQLSGKPAKKSSTINLMLQIVPEIHTAISFAAKKSGKSINQWACEVFSNAANKQFQIKQQYS